MAIQVYDPFPDDDGTIRWWNAGDGTARDLYDPDPVFPTFCSARIAQNGDTTLLVAGQRSPPLGYNKTDLLAAKDTQGDARGVTMDAFRDVYITGQRVLGNSVFRWNYNEFRGLVLDTGGGDPAYPFVDSDGYIKFADGAVIPNFSWSYDTGAVTWNADTDSEGYVYIAGTRSGNKSLWKIDRGANLIWDFDTGSNAIDVAVDADDNIYVVGGRGLGGNTIWKLSSDKAVLDGWSYGINSTLSVAVGLSGVYVGADDEDPLLGHTVMKLGGWGYNTGWRVFGLTVDSDENVYAATAVGILPERNTNWKFDGDGNLLWKIEDTRGQVVVVDADDHPYFGGRSNTRKLDKNNGSTLWTLDSHTSIPDSSGIAIYP